MADVVSDVAERPARRLGRKKGDDFGDFGDFSDLRDPDEPASRRSR